MVFELLERYLAGHHDVGKNDSSLTSGLFYSYL